MKTVLSLPVKPEKQYNHKITIGLMSVLHTFLELSSASPWVVLTETMTEGLVYAFWG